MIALKNIIEGLILFIFIAIGCTFLIVVTHLFFFALLFFAPIISIEEKISESFKKN